MRHLLVTQRRVALDRYDEYLDAWEDMRAAVLDAGGRAWIFRGTHHQDRFIEFVEWRDAPETPPLPELGPVSSARRSMDAVFGTGQGDEWEEPEPRE